jgi:hypothetical protein
MHSLSYLDWKQNRTNYVFKQDKKIKPSMEKFFVWCSKKKSTSFVGFKIKNSSQLCPKLSEIFQLVLLNGHLELSNNKTERAIKFLVMGHKNWLFSKSCNDTRSTGTVL